MTLKSEEVKRSMIFDLHTGHFIQIGMGSLTIFNLYFSHTGSCQMFKLPSVNVPITYQITLTEAFLFHKIRKVDAESALFSRFDMEKSKDISNEKTSMGSTFSSLFVNLFGLLV